MKPLRISSPKRNKVLKETSLKTVWAQLDFEFYCDDEILRKEIVTSSSHIIQNLKATDYINSVVFIYMKYLGLTFFIYIIIAQKYQISTFLSLQFAGSLLPWM